MSYNLRSIGEAGAKFILSLIRALEDKLETIEEGANKYIHPTYTAKTGAPTANQTPVFGGSFTVTQPVSDATGHITGMNSRTVTIPSTAATTSAAGNVSPSFSFFLVFLLLAEVKIKIIIAIINSKTPPQINIPGTVTTQSNNLSINSTPFILNIIYYYDNKKMLRLQTFYFFDILFTV